MSHEIHVTKIAFGGTFSMMKKNLKMVVEWPGWGAYGLSIESLSGVDWLSGCGAICGNDVPNSKKTIHYCNRFKRASPVLKNVKPPAHTFLHCDRPPRNYARILYLPLTQKWV